MNNINNNELEVSKGMELNDKDYLNIFLSCLKEMCKNYSIAMTEASNEYLFNKYKEVCDELFLLQREAFELMYKFGWYQVSLAENNKINNKHEMLKQEYNDLEL